MKEIIASKRQIEFYKQCYQKYGFSVESVIKKGQNYTIRLKHSGEALNNEQQELLRLTEAKLRVIEITDRKICGFGHLFLNLMIHILIFCSQAFVFSRLKLESTHPQIMLQVGVVILQIILLFGFVMKCIEIFRWNKTQEQLKQEILNLTELSPSKVLEKENYYISVLFTRGHGSMSELIYWITGRQYTHSAIGLGKDIDCFYSFDYRGFRIEHPSHRKLWKGQRESLCYQFKVTKEEYIQIEKEVEKCKKNQQEYGYNMVGAIFSVIRIYFPFKSKKAYFCSEFVSEQLADLDSFHLRKNAKMYLPYNLAKSLSRQKNLYKVLVNEV